MHALPFKVTSRPLPQDSALASESCLGQVLPYSVGTWFKSPNKSSLTVNLKIRINGCKTPLPRPCRNSALAVAFSSPSTGCSTCPRTNGSTPRAYGPLHSIQVSSKWVSEARLVVRSRGVPVGWGRLPIFKVSPTEHLKLSRLQVIRCLNSSQCLLLLKP